MTDKNMDNIVLNELPPEASYSVTFKEVNGKIESALWTCRGFDLNNLSEFLKNARALQGSISTPEQQGEGFPLPAPEVEEAKANEPMEVVKFLFEAKTNDKYALSLFEKFGENIGKWPSIKFTASRDDMWAMIGDTIGNDFALNRLPVENECSYWADWKWGREKQQGEGRYKDLVAIRPR